MSRLEGKRVVLTGAAGGIGSLVAKRLRMAGAYVIGVDRVDAVACQEYLACDLSNLDALEALASTLSTTHVDILVNLAGLQYFGPLDAQGATRIALGYAVNLVAPAIVSGAVLPQMIARRDGQIVNIGSVMGAVPYPYFTTYSSAKAGLKAFSQALRREVAGRNVAITYIAPRAVRTAFNTAAIERFMALSGMAADRPEDVADTIVAAIERRATDVSIGMPERVFTQLNAAVPRLIDRGLAKQVATARTLFVEP